MKTGFYNEPHFSGIATFMRSSYVSEFSTLDHDVAVIGVPSDEGVSFRGGTKYGPRAIREYSLWDSLKGGERVDLCTAESHRMNELAIADLGDVTVYPGYANDTRAAIIRSVKSIRKLAFPLIIGGDHSLTYASFKGCKEALPESLLPIGILHWDAHLDVEGGTGACQTISHGNLFRHLVDEGELCGSNMVTLGARGLLDRECMEYVTQAGITVYTVAEVRKCGINNVVLKAVSQLMKSCRSVYVTFDIDVIDPSHAPGTGTPSFGGLLATEVLQAIRLLNGTTIAAFDLVEVNPLLDQSGMTAALAASIVWEFLAFGLGRDSLRIRRMATRPSKPRKRLTLR